MNWSRTYLYQHGDNKQVEDMTDLKRWERDYQLERLSRLHLFDEYIEMSKYRYQLIYILDFFSNLLTLNKFGLIKIDFFHLK